MPYESIPYQNFLYPPSAVYYENTQLSILTDNQRKEIESLKRQLASRGNNLEYLIENTPFNSLLICKTKGLENESVMNQPFANFIITQIIIVEFPEFASLDTIYLMVLKVGTECGEKVCAMKRKDFTPGRVITFLRNISISFLIDKSDSRKGELVSDYISQKLSKATFICLPYFAGWSFSNASPRFLTSDYEIFSLLPKDLLKMPVNSRQLALSNITEPTEIIASYFHRLSLLKKETTIPISLFFHMSILRGVLDKADMWALDKFLYLQMTNGPINIEKVSQSLLQVFNNDKGTSTTLDLPFKTLLRNVLTNQDEPFILRVDNPTCNNYKQKLRVSNWDMIHNVCLEGVKYNYDGFEITSRASLVCISNQNIVDIPMENALSIYIESSDINIGVLQEALCNPCAMGNYINLLCQYISSNFNTTIKMLSDAWNENLQTGLGTFEKNGVAYSIFMTVCDFMEKFLKHYNFRIEDFWGTRNEIESLLVDFLYQNEMSSDMESIPELFIEGLRSLISGCTLINRLRDDTLLEGGNITLYCDDNFLYVSEQDLRNYIIPSIFPFHITVNQLLKSLSEAEIITSDQTRVKTYLKTVYFPKHTPPTQKKMVAFNRTRIWSLGDDIYD
ncbi:hypothetical protein FYJ38_22095 [Clostridium sp. WB02_MRS01]|uniref:hypothetical protein n=1 Tax=Clostridium sp. WB02_MRS01 TaxID=2605777 RepID=UPI0012B2E663|nr:hypothetical protein [Clostridium sp. WB02_MRS01]MSS11313.1 hypothetical protein [Clostridium sp. WB02_MRS01]